jgi:ketosteroid isomerase-like protein
MKKHLRFNKIAIVILMVTFFSAPIFAQEWSAEQKEVWENVETYWELDAKRDLEGFLGYFHEDYSGWFNLNAVPNDKDGVRKWLSHSFKTTQILVQDIMPVAIKVHGDMAIVHYYYSRLIKEADGEEENINGRWTDILKKQGDKWVLIGDHGGPDDD